MTRRKNPRNPGDIVTCACDGCGNTFVLKRVAMHQLHCSKRCRDAAAKILAAAREPLSKNARQLRMEAEAFGGTTGDGSLVCGTLSLGRRPEYDPRNPPQDDARFW